MLRLGLFVISLTTSCHCGRYQAPDPSEVRFPYTRIPTLTELIGDAGYERESHRVTTEDGYILALHRIKRPGTTSRNRGVPVLMVNGFTFQADGWLALGNSSLGFILADLGYDVWLGEPRGNLRSQKHERYSFDDFRNYNYTLHEQGVYDLPAFVDHILEQTGRSKILYVGFSLGCGLMIIMNSERPEYNDKVLGIVFLGPAGYLKRWDTNPFDFQLALTSVNSMIESQIRNGQWLAFGNINFVKGTFASCSTNIMKQLCWGIMDIILGRSTTMDKVSMPHQFGVTVTTEGIYVAKHGMQLYKHGRFCKYDYGATQNMAAYGSETPPDYNFNSTQVPVYFFYGGTDKMVTPDVARRSADNLGNLLDSEFVDGYDHADFLFSTKAPRNVYERVVDYFDRLVATAESTQQPANN